MSNPARVMDPVERKKWTAALRSRRYKQGRGWLFRKATNTFCCLGVAACELGGSKPRGGSFLLPGRFGLSRELQHALGYVNDGPPTMARECFAELGYKTTPATRSFKSIADWIDKNL